MSGSGVLAWFKCEQGPDHIYQTQIKKWLSGQLNETRGCPFCHGQYVSVTNWLHNYPDLAVEFNVKRNGGLTPKDIVAGTKVRYWWICSKGHEWKAPPHDRIQGHGCFICNVGEHVDLANYPEALKMFDRKNNKGVDIHFLLKETVVNWQCPKASDHKFAQRFYRRNYPSSPRCVFCFKSIASSTNNISLNPQWLLEFHPSKNRNLRPEMVALNSLKVLWWQCTKEKEHVWKASPRHRTYNEAGCPFCARYPTRFSGHRRTGGDDEAGNVRKIKPSLTKQWHPTKNGNLKTGDFSAFSSKKVWWKCPHGAGHEWCGQIISRTISKNKTMGCPFCSNNRVSKTNSLAARFPKISALLHPLKNGKLKASDIIAGSSRRVWWQCPQGSDHAWHEIVSALTSSMQGCPFCAGKRVSKTNSIAARFPEVAKEWHKEKNGKLLPTQLVGGSHQVVWWQCRRSVDHEWQAPPNRRCYSSRAGCPFCSGNRASVTNCLATMDPETARQWHVKKNGRLTPFDVTLRSRKVVWWKCAMGKKHSPYQQSVESRVGRPCRECGRL